MKKVLILVLSCQDSPYEKMIETSLKTWDSINVEGVESVFYCGNPVKENTDKIIYFPVTESLLTMGDKTLQAYEWALSKDFDYIARVNSSCYVNKKELIKYVQTLPERNVFAGLQVEDGRKWVWGGGQYIISRDVIELIVKNKSMLNNSIMEDRAFSYLVNSLDIPFTDGRACSINKRKNDWLCVCYGCDNMEFIDFADINKLENQFFIRVKQDGKRDLDEYVMKELYQHIL